MAPMRHDTDTAWTLEDVHECFHPGERWAYRGNARSDFQEAEIHSIVPKSKPPRIRVVLYDDGFEVKREAVPPGRLWAPWGQVDELREDGARWARVRALKPPRHEAEAAMWALIDERPGVFDYCDDVSGVGVVLDASALAAELQLDLADLHDPQGFQDLGGSVVGWTVVEKIAGAALLVDNGRKARELIGRINSWRAERAEEVEERLRTRLWDINLKYLPGDHPAFDATVEWADRLERGLQALAPGIVEIQQQEDARHLLLKAVDVMNRIRPELQRRDSPKRHGELVTEIDALIARVVGLGVRRVALRDSAHDLPTTEPE